MPSRRAMLLAALCAVPAMPGSAQAPAAAEQLAEGIAATKAHDSPAARLHFEAALRSDSTMYEADWRLAATLVDLGKRYPDDARSPARDSLYALAERYARRAVAAKPDGPDGHFVLSYTIARAALTRSTREKIHAAAEIRYEAIRTLELNPKHDGAYHILGRWNAEIMRLSSLDRFVARTFLGAAIFNEASWAAAEENLRLAVQYAPLNIYHRLDLAQVLIDRGKWAAAKEQLDQIPALPAPTANDQMYKAQAEKLAAKVAEKLRR